VAAIASATALVDSSPQEILEFVLDIHRYREVDRKIIRVGRIEGPDSLGNGSVSLWGRIGWIPPAPDRQDFRLERWSKLTFTGAARQPSRLVFDFRGTFDCNLSPDGRTSVTHAYEFRFKGPFRFFERFVTPWLQREITTEVGELAALMSSPRTAA
jgi:hypothetical protein